MGRNTVRMVLTVVAGVCGLSPLGASPAEVRAPNAFERAYTAMALDTLSHELCAKISPLAESRALFNSPGTQIVRERSRCFLYLAVNALEPGFCEQVVEASAWFLDGSYFSRENCRTLVRRGRPFNFSLSFDHGMVLDVLGYGAELARARAAAPPHEPVALVFYLNAMKRDGGDFQRRLRRLPDFSAPPGAR